MVYKWNKKFRRKVAQSWDDQIESFPKKWRPEPEQDLEKQVLGGSMDSSAVEQKAQAGPSLEWINWECPAKDLEWKVWAEPEKNGRR